jgi:hypothetical protein
MAMTDAVRASILMSVDFSIDCAIRRTGVWLKFRENRSAAVTYELHGKDCLKI